MPNTALTTTPVSYSKVCDTFRATDCTAARTHPGCESLINFEVFGPVPDGFVAELMSKLRPAGIEHGLRQPTTGEGCRADIPDDNSSILVHHSRGALVQIVPAAVSDLGMESSDALTISSTLRSGQGLGVARQLPRILDFLSRRERCECLEPQVDAEFACSTGVINRNVDLQIHVPAPSSILAEAPSVNLASNRTAEPKPIAALEKHDGIAVQADGTSGLEGHPAQGLPASPARASTCLVTRLRKLLASRLHGVGMQSELA